MKTPKQEALEICQEIGKTTMFTDCNEGYTLPLHISQKIAHVCVDKIMQAIPMYTGNLNPTWKHYQDVKKEIDLI